MKTETEIDFNSMTAILPINETLRVFATIGQDTDTEPPWKEWDGEGKVYIADKGRVMGQDGNVMGQDGNYVDAILFLVHTFPDYPLDVFNKLMEGDPVRGRNGHFYLGLEAYIHSGERWYLPGGCQIDRMFDVSPLRAIWEADEGVLANILLNAKEARDPTAEELRDYLKGRLTSWNQFLAGDVWFVESHVERATDDPEVWEQVGENDFRGGLYGEDGIDTFLQEIAAPHRSIT
jgi:hypothetical protein